MAAGVHVHVDPAKLAAFMRSPGGPVMRRMLILGDVVKEATKAELKAGFPRDFLGPQIVKRMEVVDSGSRAGPHVYVGVPKTKTRPHGIDGNPLLVFFSKKAGRVVFARHVNHPGSDFTDYVNKALLKGMAAIKGAI